MFIERIEELKEREGSYAKAAKKLGITKAALSNIMRGLTNPKDETIVSLAKEFNVQPETMIAEAHKERAHGKMKEVWANIEKKLSSVAAAMFAITLLPVFNGIQCILCKIAKFEMITEKATSTEAI